MLRSRKPKVREEGRKMLNSPPVPKGFDYLLRWAYELHGRSGFHEGGVNPLRPSELDAWARLTGRVVHPHEADALFRIDSALLSDVDPFAESE